MFWVGLLSVPLLAFVRISQGTLAGLHHVVLGQSSEFLIRPAAFLVVLSGVLVIAGQSIDALAAVSMHTFSFAATAVVALLWLRRRIPTAVRTARAQFQTKAWLMAALGLAFISGAAIVNSQMGVALLGALDGNESAGLYAVAQRGALLIAFPLAALGVALAPRAAALWATGDFASCSESLPGVPAEYCSRRCRSPPRSSSLPAPS